MEKDRRASGKGRRAAACTGMRGQMVGGTWSGRFENIV